MTYPDDKDSTDRLFIHEFLFLLCNSKPRNEMITKLPKPEWTTERKSIKQYDMQALDALRLDRLFKIELKDIGKFAKQNGGSHEPLIVMQKVLNSEVLNKNFRFEGIKITEIINTNNQKGKNKNDRQAGKSQKQESIALDILAEPEDAQTKQFNNYRDRLADPRFFTPIKTQLNNAATNANAARTGGPIMVNKFLIPGDEAEYRWLNDNMS